MRGSLRQGRGFPSVSCQVALGSSLLIEQTRRILRGRTVEFKGSSPSLLVLAAGPAVSVCRDQPASARPQLERANFTAKLDWLIEVRFPGRLSICLGSRVRTQDRALERERLMLYNYDTVASQLEAPVRSPGISGSTTPTHNHHRSKTQHHDRRPKASR